MDVTATVRMQPEAGHGLSSRCPWCDSLLRQRRATVRELLHAAKTAGVRAVLYTCRWFAAVSLKTLALAVDWLGAPGSSSSPFHRPGRTAAQKISLNLLNILFRTKATLAL